MPKAFLPLHDGQPNGELYSKAMESASSSASYPGTASTTGGVYPAGKKISTKLFTRRCNCAAAERVGRAKYRPSTSPSRYMWAKRHRAASVLPDPVSDSMIASCSLRGVSSTAACWIALELNWSRLEKPGPSLASAARCPDKVQSDLPDSVFSYGPGPVHILAIRLVAEGEPFLIGANPVSQST